MTQHNDHEKVTETENQNSLVEQELNACRAQQEELKSKLMHAAADFENYKKRAEKDRAMITTAAQAAVLSDVISIVNDFERALTESHGQSKMVESSKDSLAGFELIKKSLYKLLNTHGVQEVTQVTTFNPELHEALVHVTSPEHKAGDIVQVFEKGFTFRGNVIRPAKVSVAQ